MATQRNPKLIWHSLVLYSKNRGRGVPPCAKHLKAITPGKVYIFDDSDPHMEDVVELVGSRPVYLFLLDTDSREAQGFSKWLSSLPQPPCIVLLSEREEPESLIREWGAAGVIPYSANKDMILDVLSDPEIPGPSDLFANVIPFLGKKGDRSEASLVEPGAPEEAVKKEEEKPKEAASDPREEVRSADSKKNPAVSGRRRHVLAVPLVAAFVISLFVMFSITGSKSGDTKSKNNASKSRALSLGDAFKSVGTIELHPPEVPAEPQPGPASAPAPAAQAQNAVEASGGASTATASAGGGETNPGTEYVPPPEPPRANNPPTAWINGPSEVTAGNTYVYTAGGSDPDGDPVSLSWTSKSMAWQNRDSFQVLTVTATDGRGGSYTASKNVRVMP